MNCLSSVGGRRSMFCLNGQFRGALQRDIGLTAMAVKTNEPSDSTRRKRSQPSLCTSLIFIRAASSNSGLWFIKPNKESWISLRSNGKTFEAGREERAPERYDDAVSNGNVENRSRDA